MVEWLDVWCGWPILADMWSRRHASCPWLFCAKRVFIRQAAGEWMLAGEVHSVWQEGARHVLIFPKSIAVGEQDRSVDRQDTLCEIASAEIARGELQSEGASLNMQSCWHRFFRIRKKPKTCQMVSKHWAMGHAWLEGCFHFARCSVWASSSDCSEAN